MVAFPKSDLPVEKDSHVPVLAKEILHWIRALYEKDEWIVIDCTVGTGLLASRILDESGGKGKIIGVDRDVQVLEIARRTLAPYGDRVRLVHGRFSQLPELVREEGEGRIYGIVMDLGVSSVQLARAERGFSFLREGPLDMRMDPTQGPTAADLLEQLNEDALQACLRIYGEERYARRIARAIVRARHRHPIRTTTQLATLIEQSVPTSYRYSRIHCATRTFQALRILVNQELDELSAALPAAVEMLEPGGRICVISFHSLEDRIVKQTFRALSSGPHPRLSILTKKPSRPDREESMTNPRARSAKLRVAERVGEKV
ncbi:MAG: 16S rRNA (cytosine(1402)-N(4))-methyltransferase RsmH [Nitrospirae bacterium]|nr:MAG: 16S rRNA (cytosine(1402)-N(4))-methyltransferase RsmH [Nitrospirota bacterium]